MSTLKSIHVTQCDNELYGFVIPSTATFSTELFHFKLGGGIAESPVDYTVKNIGLLPAGNYTLFLIGINWGGPANFSVTVEFTSGAPVTESFSGTGLGVVWKPNGIPFTI